MLSIDWFEKWIKPLISFSEERVMKPVRYNATFSSSNPRSRPSRNKKLTYLSKEPDFRKCNERSWCFKRILLSRQLPPTGSEHNPVTSYPYHKECWVPIRLLLIQALVLRKVMDTTDTLILPRYSISTPSWWFSVLLFLEEFTAICRFRLIINHLCS